MSMLTHVTLWVDEIQYDPDTSQAQLNKEIFEAVVEGDPREQSMRALSPLNSDAAGGSKWYCQTVYAACFNYVGVSEVIDHLDRIADEFRRQTRMVYTEMLAVIQGEDGVPIIWTSNLGDATYVEHDPMKPNAPRGDTVIGEVVTDNHIFIESGLMVDPGLTYSLPSGQRQQPRRKNRSKR